MNPSTIKAKIYATKATNVDYIWNKVSNTFTTNHNSKKKSHSSLTEAGSYVWKSVFTDNPDEKKRETYFFLSGDTVEVKLTICDAKGSEHVDQLSFSSEKEALDYIDQIIGFNPVVKKNLLF